MNARDTSGATVCNRNVIAYILKKGMYTQLLYLLLLRYIKIKLEDQINVIRMHIKH